MFEFLVIFKLYTVPDPPVSLSCSQDTIKAEESTGGEGHRHCRAVEERGPQRVREIRPNVRHHRLPGPAAGHRAAEEGEG